MSNQNGEEKTVAQLERLLVISDGTPSNTRIYIDGKVLSGVTRFELVVDVNKTLVEIKQVGILMPSQERLLELTADDKTPEMEHLRNAIQYAKDGA